MRVQNMDATHEIQLDIVSMDTYSDDLWVGFRIFQALDRAVTRDVLRALLHSILFHRLFGTIQPRCVDVLDVTFVSRPEYLGSFLTKLRQTSG